MSGSSPGLLPFPTSPLLTVCAQNSQSQRILWLLEELEIPYNLELHQRVEQRSPPALKQTHPLGKAPQLETGDGRVIAESVVIAKYLIDTYDKAGKFKGDGSAKNDTLRDEQLCNLAAASLGPVMLVDLILLFASKMTPFFVRWLMALVHSQIRNQFSGPELALYYRYLDDQLEGQDYFMGNTAPARADFILSYPVDQCVAANMVDLTKYPRLEKWHARIHERPAWKRSLEKGNGYNLGLN
ncbi:Glutathione S-transferase 3 [Cladophialophora carrionii]|uniref:Glutathione S-transferase 3 n=1 Tax=Cladophialophora carrionii TaxID=86049 RepID=A0A1C1CRM7_9EURO|nr:Glutathione S-transferase 3 [Cladophialophora carrionii]